MTREEQAIDTLIEAFASATGDWAAELGNGMLHRRMTEAEGALRARIKVIISERDELRRQLNDRQ